MASGYNLESGIRTVKSIDCTKKSKVSVWFKSIKTVVLQSVKEFCKNTTLHGLSYLTNKDLYPMERAFFALSFVTVVIIAGIFIKNVYTKWNTTPVIFSINPQPTYITNEPFPALTICNMNVAYKTKVKEYAKDSAEYAMIQMLCKREVNVTVADTINDWSTLNEFISDISQPCENMFISCRFGGTDYNCNHIFHPIITDEGLCCAFNMVHPKFMYTKGTQSLINETYTNLSEVEEAVPWNAETGYPKNLPKQFYPRTAAGTGESLGLTITLDVEADQYYCSSTNSIGFKMAMHSPTETPNVREVGLLVAAGYETKARVRIDKLEADRKLHEVHLKHRQCEFQDEHRLKYFSTYTQANCEAECVANSLMRHCRCLSHYMPKRFENETVCSIYDSECVERIRLHSMLNDDDDDERECDEVCLPSCYDLRFYAEFFSTPLQHGAFVNKNSKIWSLPEDYVKNNIAILTMYYKDNSFRSSKQTEFIGMTDVLSSMGGLIGLFFGFSFISVAEILFYTLIRPWRKVPRHSQKSKSKSTNKHKELKQSPKVVIKFSSRPMRTRKNCSSPFRVSPKIRNISEKVNLDQCYVGRNISDVSPLEGYTRVNSQYAWRKDSMA